MLLELGGVLDLNTQLLEEIVDGNKGFLLRELEEALH